MTARERRAEIRAERRRAERQDRKSRLRHGANSSRSPSVLMLSVAAVGLGLLAVLVFALINTPQKPAVALNEPLARTPIALADGLTLGAADAPVTVETWSDFQCPFCARLVETNEPALIDRYVTTGKVRLVYRDMAFLGNGGPNDESVSAAVAARCAARDNLFWAFHDYLFANQAGENRGAFAQPRLEAIAQAVGLNLDEFRACQAEPQIRQAVAVTEAAATAAGVKSTPTLDVNGDRLEGVRDFATLEQAIEQALAASPAR